MRIQAAYVVLSGVFALGACQTAANDQVTEEPTLIGAWRLVSWQNTDATGQTSHPFGENPGGQIIYTESGRMSAQLMYPGVLVEDITGVDEADIIGIAARTFFAYYGRYTVDPEAGTVTHHVEGALRPSWRGVDQVRRFEMLGDDRIKLLTIRNPEVRSNTTGSNELIWERIR